MTATVTRFNTFTRPANEAEGTDERDVVRLFEKRKHLADFDIDDISRDEWEDDLATFLETTPTLEQVMDWLSAEPGDEDEAEEEERETGSIVPLKYRLRYGSEQNCGDAIALALTAFVTEPRKTKKNSDGGLDRAKLRAVAAENGIGDKLADWEGRGLNGGLLRMNTSNILRGIHRRGLEVTIGDQKWPAREVEKTPRKRASKAKNAAKAK